MAFAGWLIVTLPPGALISSINMGEGVISTHSPGRINILDVICYVFGVNSGYKYISRPPLYMLRTRLTPYVLIVADTATARANDNRSIKMIPYTLQQVNKADVHGVESTATLAGKFVAGEVLAYFNHFLTLKK